MRGRPRSGIRVWYHSSLRTFWCRCSGPLEVWAAGAGVGIFIIRDYDRRVCRRVCLFVVGDLSPLGRPRIGVVYLTKELSQV